MMQQEQKEHKRPELPSLPEWLLRDPLAATGLVLASVSLFLAGKIAIAWQAGPPRQEQLAPLALFLVPAVVIYFGRIRLRWTQWDLARRGTPVEGKVETVSKGSWTVGGVRYVHAQYCYRFQGSEFQAWTPEFHPNKLGLARGGAILLWVDPSRPKRHAWLGPGKVHGTRLTRDHGATVMIGYARELAFLTSVVFVGAITTIVKEPGQWAREFARANDPMMVSLLLGVVLMIVSMVFLVWRKGSRPEVKDAGWLVFTAAFYVPWAFTAFQLGALLLLVPIGVFGWAAGRKRRL